MLNHSCTFLKLENNGSYMPKIAFPGVFHITNYLLIGSLDNGKKHRWWVFDPISCC